MTKKYHLEPQTGIGLTINKGQFLKIIDPTGEQVSDSVGRCYYRATVSMAAKGRGDADVDDDDQHT